MDERDYKAINDELKGEPHIGDTNKMVTAVEWLFSQIPFEWSSSRAAFEALQQAKQMDKEQKKYFFDCGRQYQLTGEGTFTQVYNETYKK